MSGAVEWTDGSIEHPSVVATGDGWRRGRDPSGYTLNLGPKRAPELGRRRPQPYRSRGSSACVFSSYFCSARKVSSSQFVFLVIASNRCFCSVSVHTAITRNILFLSTPNSFPSCFLFDLMRSWGATVT
jgi:hypothetical protein